MIKVNCRFRCHNFKALFILLCFSQYLFFIKKDSIISFCIIFSCNSSACNEHYSDYESYGRKIFIYDFFLTLRCLSIFRSSGSAKRLFISDFRSDNYHYFFILSYTSGMKTVGKSNTALYSTGKSKQFCIACEFGNMFAK